NQYTIKHISIPCGSYHNITINSDLSDFIIFGWHFHTEEVKYQMLKYNSITNEEYKWISNMRESVYIFDYGKHYLSLYEVTAALNDSFISFEAEDVYHQKLIIKFSIEVTTPCHFEEYSKEYSKSNKLFYKNKPKELIYTMEDITTSEIMEIMIFNYDKFAHRQTFDDIDEAIKSGQMFIDYNDDIITVNPFNHEKKYMAIQIKANGKLVFRTYPLYVFHMIESVKKIVDETIEKSLVSQKHISIKYEMEKFSEIESEFLTDMFYLAFKTAREYKDLVQFSSTWNEFVNEMNFTLIMFAGRNSELNYWFIAHISECLLK
ncbi:hypothetical protein HZS_6127, partial [Henneguya salminicola]